MAFVYERNSRGTNFYGPTWNVPAGLTLSDELPRYTVYSPGATTQPFGFVLQ